MKIAVPTEGGQIAPHFGSCKTFRLYTTDEFDEITGEESISAPGDGYAHALPLLQAAGAQLIICAGIGAYAVRAIRDANIMLMGGASGNARDRVMDFLSGTLKFYQPGEPGPAAPAPGDAEGTGDGIETDGNIAACEP